MDAKLSQLEIRSLGDCTIREITEQWHTCWQQYPFPAPPGFFDISIEKLTAFLGRSNIHPELSVAGYIGGIPAGFVLIGLANVGGRKLSWNGGTAVNPEFRGLSLSKLLLQEAIRRTQAVEAESLWLETHVDNERAIRSYLGCGFRIRETLHHMNREGAFTSLPFLRSRSADYRIMNVTPDVAGRLAFYQEASNSWTTQWFHADVSEASIALDSKGETAGYALYRKSFSADGMLESVMLIQCEADPKRSDGDDVVRYLLGEVFSPLAGSCIRKVKYLRESNTDTLAALREAGFHTVIAEKLMVLDFNH